MVVSMAIVATLVIVESSQGAALVWTHFNWMMATMICTLVMMMMKMMITKLVNLSWRLTTWLIDQPCGFCVTIRMRLRTRAILLQISRKTGVFFWPLVAHCPPIAMTPPHMPTIAALCQRSRWTKSPSREYQNLWHAVKVIFYWSYFFLHNLFNFFTHFFANISIMIQSTFLF